MNLFISCNYDLLEKGIRDLVKLLFSEINLIDSSLKNETEFLDLEVIVLSDISRAKVKFILSYYSDDNNKHETLKELILEEEIYENNEIQNQLKRMAKLGLYQILSRYLGKQFSPWGILTGIRPTKIVHRLIDQGWQGSNIKNHLIGCYEVREDKAELLINVAFRQRKYLLNKFQAENLVSIYIGIPFCPTRCAYCSFPAYSLKQWGKLVDPYLEALHMEITKVGKLLRKFNLRVETLYIGGGTPTSLKPEELDKLIYLINQEIISEETKEFTVEAGRPDTISIEMLKVLKAGGVNRLSINPQSMQEKTLRKIGRNHTPLDIIEKVTLARELGFDNINMDIIIGLPGEKSEDVQITMDAINEIKPENLTVHTMAIKRASRLKEERENYQLPEDIEVSKMYEITQEAASAMNMHPYYLYRQKQILGQLENIGFAKENYDCLYNIQMMEERQTIIGLGVGSGSKFVRPGIWTLESMYNPKDIINYNERIEELIKRKEDLLSKIMK